MPRSQNGIRPGLSWGATRKHAVPKKFHTSGRPRIMVDDSDYYGEGGQKMKQLAERDEKKFFGNPTLVSEDHRIPTIDFQIPNNQNMHYYWTRAQQAVSSGLLSIAYHYYEFAYQKAVKKNDRYMVRKFEAARDNVLKEWRRKIHSK